MSCYTINLKQLRNCGLSLNDKMRYEEKGAFFMGGPYVITKIKLCSDEGSAAISMSMWDMLDTICENYSTDNEWVNLSTSEIFKEINKKYITKDPTTIKPIVVEP